MKVMVCIPMEVNVDTTGRKEIKDAVQKKLLGLEGQALMGLKTELEIGRFLVRKPERIPGFDE